MKFSSWFGCAIVWLLVSSLLHCNTYKCDIHKNVITFVKHSIIFWKVKRLSCVCEWFPIQPDADLSRKINLMSKPLILGAEKRSFLAWMTPAVTKGEGSKLALFGTHDTKELKELSVHWPYTAAARILFSSSLPPSLWKEIVTLRGDSVNMLLTCNSSRPNWYHCSKPAGKPRFSQRFSFGLYLQQPSNMLLTLWRI